MLSSAERYVIPSVAAVLRHKYNIRGVNVKVIKTLKHLSVRRLCLQSMSRHYAELFKLNNQLIGEYVKRSNNHQALLEALKEVNHTIQKAANLRMGQAKTKVRCPTEKA